MAHVVRRQSKGVGDVVVDSLLTQIRSGKYKPGDRIPTETEFSQQFGISRTSVREVMAKLRIIGVVEVRRGLGTFVTDVVSLDARMGFLNWTAENHYEIAHIFEVRISLETTAASLAAARSNDDNLFLLEKKAQAHAEAVALGDLERMILTDQEFHSALMACSGNDVLQRVYEIFVPDLVPYRRKSLALPEAPGRSSSDHFAIVNSIRLRQPAGAQIATLRHLTVLLNEIEEARDSALNEKPLLQKLP